MGDLWATPDSGRIALMSMRGQPCTAGPEGPVAGGVGRGQAAPPRSRGYHRKTRATRQARTTLRVGRGAPKKCLGPQRVCVSRVVHNIDGLSDSQAEVDAVSVGGPSVPEESAPTFRPPSQVAAELHQPEDARNVQTAVINTTGKLRISQS